MGVSSCHLSGEKIFGKLSQNSPIPVLIFWGSIPCVFCLYIIYCTLLKVAIMISVLSMSVMGIEKKFG